tara:strand:- start:551 stop:1009 length:459 start_codon:yes stop_codon:yes gene_type:complete
MWFKILVFLFFNFSALALGGIFAGSGAGSVWYDELNKAPWTPPGWVFGFAWTAIMVCFAVYMALLLKRKTEKRNILSLYFVQWLLNVAWNPTFFYFHKANLGLVLIVCLTILVTYFLFNFRKYLKGYSLLILPYFIWLCIATSLNAYISIMN